MQAISDLVERGDFDGALEAFRQADREGKLDQYRPRPTDYLDVRELRRSGEIQPRQGSYRGIALTWTEDQVSASRAWFRCPSCGHRCAILLDHNCRRCAGIRYRSQYEPRLERLRAKATNLRDKLCGRIEMFDLPPTRPYRMRRDIYRRLLDELEATEMEAVRQMDVEPGFTERLTEQFRVVRETSALLDRRVRR